MTNLPAIITENIFNSETKFDQAEEENCKKYYRCTPQEFENRIETVTQMILCGYRPYWIKKKLAESVQFNTSQRTVYRYINEAWKRIRATHEKDLSKQVSWLIGSKRQLLALAIKEKEYHTANQIQNDIAKLEGLWTDRVIIIDDKDEAKLIETARKKVEQMIKEQPKEISGKSEFEVKE